MGMGMGMKNRLRRKRCVLTRLISGLLVIMLLISSVGMEMSALAIGATKDTVSRAIAIVFDNSGSMYMNYNKAWCRATYAIEVFASMMNEGDILQVYPMYDVTVGGVTYTSQNPFAISGGDDTSVIQTMYSPYGGDTPIETIGDAYNGLKKVRADEKWLIVLTDGAEFYENEEPLGEGEPTKLRLEEVLTEYNRDVNVLYLGIDTVGTSETVKAVIPEVADNGAYQYHSARAANSADTLTRLTEMCNMIFGRDVLAGAGSRLAFDVSMRKLILFVQGTNISNVTLTDGNGSSVGSPSLEYSPRYGVNGVGSLREDGTPYLKVSYDDSLSGYIAVYDTELDAGTYNLSYSGDVSSVNVYYEPDIDLTATLTDSFGSVMTAGAELYPGTYSINYGLVDKNGNTTTSRLLGDTRFVVTYSINGEEKVARTNESGQVQVELAEGDELDGKINVTYLSGYSITKTAKDFNWPSGGFKIVARPVGALELQVAGGRDSYLLTQVGEGVYDLRLSYEGELLTGTQLASSEVALALDGGNLTYDLTRTDAGYTVVLKHAGDAADTLCGPYSLRVAARFTNEFGVTSTSDEVSVPFTVEDVAFTLSMDVDGGREYVISKLPNSEPVVVNLAIDGKPLTDEQLAGITLTADGEGLTLEQEPLPGESAFAVRIVGDDNAQKGRYDLTFRAETHDSVGRAVTAEGDTGVKLRTLPAWIPLVIAIAILLLIILLIWLYMNMKVLPKKIEIDKSRSSFSVNGEEISCTIKCTPTVFGKRTGSIQVAVPRYTDDTTLRGTVTLNLTAVSPRRVKSSGRQAMVTSIALGSAVAQKASVGAHDLIKNEDGDTAVWTFDGREIGGRSTVGNTSFTISGSPVVTISGQTLQDNDFILRAQLKFK